MLTELAIWDAPHDFAHAGHREFSYGLLLPDLHGLTDEEGRARLRSRWGEVEVEELDRIDLTDTRRHHLEPFLQAVTAAAAERSRVPDGWGGDLKLFLEDVQRRDLFLWRWQNVGGLWMRVRVPRYDRLFERLAIEYDQLLTRRPLLSVCTLCDRVFVPQRASRPERHCRANLWLVASPPRQLERCIPLDETERNREWKRLDQRYRRALARADGKLSDRDVVAAKRALGEWIRANPPARRGRQEQPVVGPIPNEPK